MSDDTISKPKARRVRLVCQIVAVVFAAGGAMVVVIGVPFMDKPSASPIAFTTIEGDASILYQAIQARRSENESTEEELPADVLSIEFSLESIGNAPVKAAEPVANVSEEPGEKPKSASTGSKTRFIGTIGIGDRLLALVSAGGAQRVLGEGQEAVLAVAPGDQSSPPKVKVRGVSNTQVVLVEDGTEYTLDRAPREGVAVSTSAATYNTPSTDPEPTLAASRGFTDVEQVKAVNPDDYRREDGTIDYEALRSAARERAKQRQELRRKERDND